MSILDEIDEIAKREFDSWTKDMYMSAVVRLITLELFIRMQQNADGTHSHIWLTNSNHPLLLGIFNQTTHVPFSNELLEAVTIAYSNMLNLNTDEVASLVQSIVTPEELEEEL